MPSNFAFLAGEWDRFYDHARQAEQHAQTAPRTSAFYSRLTIESVLEWMYAHDTDLKAPYERTLSNLLQQRELRELPGMAGLLEDLHTIRKAGNAAAHSNQAPVTAQRAILVLRKLYRFLQWFAQQYSQADVAYQAFDLSMIPQQRAAEKSAQQMQALQEKFEQHQEELRAARARLQDETATRQQLEAELAEIKARKERRPETQTPPPSASEAETRTFLIDLQLSEARWDITTPESQEYEVMGMPKSTNPSGRGYVDYVLWGTDGKPLAVVEAKKTSANPKQGQHQAKLYADCLEATFGRRPVMYYTNGYVIHFWDDQQYPPRRVQGFHTRDELEQLVYRRTHRKSPSGLFVKKEIAGRYYQKQAIKHLAKDLEQGYREALLVMATGTGKTRTAIAAVELLARAEWVKRVLFLADRNALVRQAKNAFKTHLPEMPGINLTQEKDNPGARLVFSTYPTMMNKIDKGLTGDGQYFGPGYFDLVIIDEAHRSVYQKYGAIFGYFDALLLGLTATPKAEVDKNTYQLFHRPDNDPTFAYELGQAVDDGYLVPYRALNVPSKFIHRGIKYHELSPEEQAEYEELFRDEETGAVPDEIGSEALNKWLFNSDTVDHVLTYLMTNGLKVEGGDKLGKTIIFAKNHRHAEFIEERFNVLFPQLKGGFLRIIDNYDKYAEKSIDDFGTTNKLPQIAVSVDMLDTGIDIPEVVNLVLFKRVYSKSKFWQMLGRGTRLCPDLFGPGQDKAHFYVFDFCDNFTFFNENPDGIEPNVQPSLTEKIFRARLELSAALQADEFQDEAHQRLRQDQLDRLHTQVKQLDGERFMVRPKLAFVHRYEDRSTWDTLSLIDRQDIVEHLAPLIPVDDSDELARRFDLLALHLMLALVNQEPGQKRHIEKVWKTGEQLLQIAHIPAVRQRIQTIRSVQTRAFWENVSVVAMEKVREDLRELVQLIEREQQKIYYTHFDDELGTAEETDLTYQSQTSEGYRVRVERYIRQHIDHLTIRKLHTNRPITSHELVELERILFDGDERGTKEDFIREMKSEQPLGTFIRSLLGLDVNAAKAAFSEFLDKGHLGADQIAFINQIIEYFQHEGILDKRLLFESPFTDRHDQSVFGLFSEPEAERIIQIIDEVNENARAAG